MRLTACSQQQAVRRLDVVLEHVAFSLQNGCLVICCRKAIRVAAFGGPEVLKMVADVPIPKVDHGQVKGTLI